jgi:hypothetical protein
MKSLSPDQLVKAQELLRS